MPTITRYAHSNLESFLKAVVTNAAAGDFLDASKWPRSYIGQRPYSSFPNVDVTTSKTKPTGSGHAATTGDKLYTETFPQPFGVFLNDVQLAVATGGAQAGKEIESITLPSRLRPYSRMNVTFKAAAIVVTITPKAAPTDFKVGDADLALSALFTVAPTGEAANVTMTSGTPANASIVAGKVHAVKAGTSVITATHTDGTTATLTITVKAAPTITAKSPTATLAVAATVDAKTLFTSANGTPTFTVDASGHVTLGADGFTLTGATAGDTVVTGTNGTATATVTITVA